MITSIVVDGCHTIGMNGNKKICINDNLLSVEKDIPFIRYRFDTYGEEQFNYIKKMQQQFNCSTHLLEINLDENTESIISYVKENINNVAKYLYINVDNTMVANKALPVETIEQLRKVVGYGFDRYMLRDKSTTLDTVSFKEMIKPLTKQLGINSKDIGICSSPLSFSDLACLTAVRARELMSIYSPIADVALPSANHQCMNCCGCIRHMVVSGDVEAPADTKVVTKKKSSGNSADKKEAKPKKAKAKGPGIVIGRYAL